MQRNQLAHGELTEIIIGTVVASGDQGITAPELAAKLKSWGIERTTNHIRCRLAELAAQGRIERAKHGRYEGV
jgi:hypothetical protein